MLPLLIFSALSPRYLPRFGLRAVVFASMVLVALGFLCMRTLGTDAGFLDLFWPLLVISSGFGLCTASAVGLGPARRIENDELIANIGSRS